MITKPEDAVPHEAFVEITPENGHPHTEIVDSQAQKIAEQAMQIEKLAGLNHVAEAQIERQEMQIAKQAKEIERLKDRLRFEMQPEAKEGL